MEPICYIVGAMADTLDICPQPGDLLIAADAGLPPVQRAGLTPDLIVGDFDSLGYVPREKRVSRYPEHKDQSDMELAMEKAVNFRHDTLFIYGGIGGRLDHTLANLQLFASFSERGVAASKLPSSR